MLRIALSSYPLSSFACDRVCVCVCVRVRACDSVVQLVQYSPFVYTLNVQTAAPRHVNITRSRSVLILSPLQIAARRSPEARPGKPNVFELHVGGTEPRSSSWRTNLRGGRSTCVAPNAKNWLATVSTVVILYGPWLHTSQTCYLVFERVCEF
jgi:hypothetical protein